MSSEELKSQLEGLYELIRNMQTVARLPTVLTKENAARELADISLRTLNRMIADGEILTVEISPGRVGIPRSEIERLAKPKTVAVRAAGGNRRPKPTSDGGLTEAEKIRAALKKPRKAQVSR